MYLSLFKYELFFKKRKLHQYFELEIYFSASLQVLKYFVDIATFCPMKINLT